MGAAFNPMPGGAPDAAGHSGRVQHAERSPGLTAPQCHLDWHCGAKKCGTKPKNPSNGGAGGGAVRSGIGRSEVGVSAGLERNRSARRIGPDNCDNCSKHRPPNARVRVESTRPSESERFILDFEIPRACAVENPGPQGRMTRPGRRATLRLPRLYCGRAGTGLFSVVLQHA